jgi:calcineurin-like phosphoesterase family protein
MPYANLFGHVHNSPIIKTYSRQHYCVSVERIDYTPVSFEEIGGRIQGRD